MWRTKLCGAPSCRSLAEKGKNYCEVHRNYQAEHAKFLQEKRPWERWYHRAHWRNLRMLVLHRDPICMWKEGCRQPSTDADHIVPHKGDWSLFCDLTNLQGLCAAHHTHKTNTEDGGWGNIRRKQNAGIL
jgi:5-methylcytosine-specific restriction enzyme A